MSSVQQREKLNPFHTRRIASDRQEEVTSTVALCQVLPPILCDPVTR
jgi:hypothetical protein